MSKIIEYKIESAGAAHDLEKLVKSALAESWQPYGPLVIAMLPKGGTHQPIFMQPLVKYSE